MSARSAWTGHRVELCLRRAGLESRRAWKGLDFWGFSWKMGVEEVDPKPLRARMAREIDRKLRLTAAVLGAVTRKDLAAAFRRVNPATPFDIDRANKWMQGRAQPRELQLYEDWAKLLDLGRSGQWIADCDSETFLETLCACRGADPVSLRDRLAHGSPLGQQQERGPALAGTYVSYSHAWSPYFRGRLIRGEMAISAGSAPHRLAATYAEVLPTGPLKLAGSLTASARAITMELHEVGGEAHFSFCLFPATPPVSVLGGFMCGATVIGPDAQPSTTRIILLRLPEANEHLRKMEAYLAADASVAEDLAALGLKVAHPAAVDRQLSAFLRMDRGDGPDQIPIAGYRALVEIFDRLWLETPDRPSAGRHEMDRAGITAKH